MASSDPFVRFSTPLLEALLAYHLTAVQLRIILWVLRNTDGWNRKLTPFSWYRIAKKLGSPRAVVWRAGQKLLQANVLLLEDGQLGIQKGDARWRIPRLLPAAEDPRQLQFPGTDVPWEQRRRYLQTTQALPGSNAGVTAGQRKRYQQVTLFRRDKEISKERIKKYIKTGAATGVGWQPFQSALSEQYHPAGAARPIPGKYDRLSQDR
jgi:phage replication O-like protein O